MNIVIYVNYSDSNFNKDFEIANVLLLEHNVFFAINNRQLDDLYKKCDILLRGLSAKDIILSQFTYYDLNDKTYLEDIKLLEKNMFTNE